MTDRDQDSDRPPDPSTDRQRNDRENPPGGPPERVRGSDPPADPRSASDPLSDPQAIADSRLSAFMIERLPSSRILRAKYVRMHRTGGRSKLSVTEIRERLAKLRKRRPSNTVVNREPVDGKTKAAGNGGEK